MVHSKKKAKLAQTKINFLGLEIEEGKLRLQNHILEHIQAFPGKIRG